LRVLLGKTAPENSPIPLIFLFPDNSTDSEDFSDKFFRLMSWNDFSEEEKSSFTSFTSFTQNDEREPLSVLRTFLVLLIVLMTSSLIMIILTESHRDVSVTMSVFHNHLTIFEIWKIILFP